jgi:hypothetical protein
MEGEHHGYTNTKGGECEIKDRADPLPENYGGLLKADSHNRIYPTSSRLKEYLAAAAQPWPTLAALV